MNMPFYRAIVELEYVMMLEKHIHNHNNGHASRLGVISYCLLNDPYDCLLFLNRSGMWRKAVKYAVKYRVGDDDKYFIGWHSRDFFMISLEKSAKIFLKVPDYVSIVRALQGATRSDKSNIFLCDEKVCRGFIVLEVSVSHYGDRPLCGGAHKHGLL